MFPTTTSMTAKFIYYNPINGEVGMNRLKQNLNLNKIVLILKEGNYVVCAVSGKNIPLSELSCWNVDLTASLQENKLRYEQIKLKK